MRFLTKIGSCPKAKLGDADCRKAKLGAANCKKTKLGAANCRKAKLIGMSSGNNETMVLFWHGVYAETMVLL
jgi:uncharacterized protein YjbI with pentapeptide repeats